MHKKGMACRVYFIIIIIMKHAWHISSTNLVKVSENQASKQMIVITNISKQHVKCDHIEQNAYVVSVDPMIHFHYPTKPPKLAPKVFHVMLNAGLLVGFLAGFVTLFVGGELFNQIITGGFNCWSCCGSLNACHLSS